MASVNFVHLIGRIGRDPEVRGQSGSGPARFSLATTQIYKDQQGNRQERTDWHTIVCFGGTKKFVLDYLRKGNLISVIGAIQTRQWTDDSGAKRTEVEIFAQNIQNLTPRPQQQGQGGYYDDGGNHDNQYGGM